MPGGEKAAQQRLTSSRTSKLDQALIALEGAPGLGLRCEPKPGIRRLLLQRTSYHLYFVVQADRVYVVAVWSSYRGRGPAL
jgi:hypothetical protein